MLTRRNFATYASCVLCGITDFIATEASAQGAVGTTTTVGGATRKVLAQTDGPMPGYTTLLMDVSVGAGVAVGRHTHPGIESSLVLEGDGLELPIQGQPTRMLKAGDGFQIPPGTPHAGGKPSATKTRLIITYVVEKGKPLASPA
jgi:quercetin dioxygenase-like cupin family protein